MSSALPNSTQTITNLIFGLTATIISVVTVWQGHRVWKMWREHHAPDQESVAPDIELGIQSVPSTPTSSETPEPEGIVASSEESANHVEEVAGPNNVPVSVQDLELQSTLPTTVDAETSLSPDSTQGAETEHEEHARTHTENVEPAMTETELGELHPAANDDLGPGSSQD